MIEFRTSSFCTLGNCVEVGALPAGGVVMRDSKDPAGGQLTFSRTEWAEFVAAAKSAYFDPS